MSEELNNEQPVQEPEQNATVDQAVEQPAVEPTAEAVVEPAAEPAAEPAQPQVIVQKERGFSHYVGFALLSVLCICFFFLPGIAITFGVSCAVDLSAAAAWIFSAILSVIAWLVFKMKIKGFKKSFYWYIGLCVLVLAILIAIQVMTEVSVFANILTLLTGAKA
ncbi:MAG: hypothetical protein MJY99_03040 [Fibrobacter sp.]|nr:hypothetical protein [Fibrobacter sp.]